MCSRSWGKPWGWRNDPPPPRPPSSLPPSPGRSGLSLRLPARLHAGLDARGSLRLGLALAQTLLGATVNRRAFLRLTMAGGAGFVLTPSLGLYLSPARAELLPCCPPPPPATTWGHVERTTCIWWRNTSGTIPQLEKIWVNEAELEALNLPQLQRLECPPERVQK